MQTVEQFDAEVRVTRGSETVGGTSIMGLMMLGAGTGTTITVEATGAEAAAAVDALAKLVASRFRRRGLARVRVLAARQSYEEHGLFCHIHCSDSPR